MKITLVQNAPKLNRSNLIYTIAVIEQLKDETDLIVFSELSLNGYMLQDKLYEDAWTLDDLNELKELSKHVDIVVGGAIIDSNVFRNSALYFSNGLLLKQHNKLHLPNYGMFEEARYFEAGDEFKGFKSKFGKISMLICEDLWHTKIHEKLIKENPDYIIALVASPARGFNDDGLEIQTQWMDIIKTVSKECKAKLVFVNRVGFEDGLGFWGGSCILDENSNIICQLPKYETIIKTIDISVSKEIA